MQKDNLQGSTIVLHGPPKVGKTQLASKFPGPILWLTTERGHKYIPEKQRNVKLTRDDGWETFINFVKTKKTKAKTYVIDTVTGLYDMCFNHTCKVNGWNHPSDGPHGKGWAAVKKEFIEGLGRLIDLADKHNSTVIIIDHSKVDLIETTTAEIEKVVCSMPGQARGVVLPIPDHIWFLAYDEKDAKDALRNETTKRCLFIKGNGLIEAGTRDDTVTISKVRPLSKKTPYQQIIKELYHDSSK